MVTVTVAAELVLPLCVVSPPYETVIDPDPADVPMNVTEQLSAVSVQVVVLNEPPVVPAVNVNVTVPVGVFPGAVVSLTVTLTDDVQLVPPRPMLQLTS